MRLTKAGETRFFYACLLRVVNRSITISSHQHGGIEMSVSAITKAYKHGTTRIAIFQVGDQFKIMKKVINYVRGQNVESWRTMGSASTFSDLSECVKKFGSLVNKTRASEGKSPINFTAG